MRPKFDETFSSLLDVWAQIEDRRKGGGYIVKSIGIGI